MRLALIDLGLVVLMVALIESILFFARQLRAMMQDTGQADD